MEDKYRNQIDQQKRPKHRNPQERFEAIVKHIDFKASRDSVPKTTLQLKTEKLTQQNHK